MNDLRLFSLNELYKIMKADLKDLTEANKMLSECIKEGLFEKVGDKYRFTEKGSFTADFLEDSSTKGKCDD